MNKNEINVEKKSSILRLQAIHNSLKPVERRAADFIMQNPQEVMSCTIIELSNKSNTSYATINRLIKRLGFTGFKELKKYLYQDILRHTKTGLEPNTLDFLDVMTFSQGAGVEEICKNIYDFSSKILEESHNIISFDALNNTAQMLLTADNLCIIGTGLSGISARYAYSRFFRIGIHCYFDEDSTLYRMQSSLLSKNDVLFAISSSGRSINILDCAKIAKKNQVNIISLTDYAVSPLSKLATVNLFTTPRNASQFLNIDMPLVIGQIFIIDVLYMLCCVKMGKQSSEIYIKTKQSADSEKIH